MRRFVLAATLAVIAGACISLQAQTTYQQDLAFDSLIDSDSSRHVVGTEIPRRARFVNSGTNDLDSGRVFVRVFSPGGSVVDMHTVVVDTLWKAGEVREVSFRPWATPIAATYFIEYCGYLRGDENPDNDCSARFTVNTVIDSSIAAGDPHKDPHHPRMDKEHPWRQPVAVEVPFTNRNRNAVNALFSAAISWAETGLVYYRNVGATLKPGETSIIKFPDFVPTASGMYHIKAWSYAENDDVPENDTVSWSFMVGPAGVSSVKPLPTPSTLHLQVLPNPSARSATIRYAMSDRQASRIVVSDGSGRQVRSMAVNDESGVIPLDLADLPSGIYTVRIIMADGHETSTRMVVQK